jgi:hypothetical protein
MTSGIEVFMKSLSLSNKYNLFSIKLSVSTTDYNITLGSNQGTFGFLSPFNPNYEVLDETS